MAVTRHEGIARSQTLKPECPIFWGTSTRTNRHSGAADGSSPQGGSVSDIHQSSRLNDELRLRILRRLSEQPETSQRELAQELGLSLGKTNYCLRALIERGWVKVNNFRNSDNKLAYAYVLTAHGLRAKFRAASRFLERKQDEYIRLEREIELLRAELSSTDEADAPSGR